MLLFSLRTSTYNLPQECLTSHFIIVIGVSTSASLTPTGVKVYLGVKSLVGE